MPNGTDAKDDSQARLSRERVLVAAVAMADASGIGSVTMRRLAQQLGVEAMSLYHHVANKEDILDGMVDRVFGEIDLPSSDDWKTAMRERANSARQALLSHPWAIGLLDSRSSPGPATLRHHNAVIGSLRGAGFTIEMTARAFAVLDSYIYGFVLQETGLPFRNPEELAGVAETILQDLPSNEYAHLAELTREYVLRPDYDFAKEYAFGLDLILDGLERLRGT